MNIYFPIIYFTLLIMPSCSLFYVVKQGSYQAQMLMGAKPIEKTLRRTDLSIDQRNKLIEVIKIRKFAENILGLHDNKNYKNVNIDWHNPVYNVSACEALSFTPYQWWFPIIGHVPYKGFFSREDADKEEARLKDLGYETYIYQIPGYSSLGYFADPIWPSMLSLSEIALCDLIIHELTHRALYIPNQTNFNETLANFVAQKATKRFYKENYNENLDEYYLSLEKREKFFQNLYVKLDELYKNANLTDEEKTKKKKEILNNANVPNINNAYLMSYKRYNDNMPYFEDMFIKSGQDFLVFLDKIEKDQAWLK